MKHVKLQLNNSKEDEENRLQRLRLRCRLSSNPVSTTTRETRETVTEQSLRKKRERERAGKDWLQNARATRLTTKGAYILTLSTVLTRPQT